MRSPALLQPELRALEMLGTVPAGCILVPVTNENSYPHLRPGEFAVVDTNARTPIDRELFLIRWETGRRNPHEPFCTSIVETFLRKMDGAVGHPPGTAFWWTGALGRPRSRGALDQALRTGKGPSPVIDGPYSREEYLAEKLVGQVVGIYAPAFEEPRRLSA